MNQCRGGLAISQEELNYFEDRRTRNGMKGSGTKHKFMHLGTNQNCQVQAGSSSVGN